MVKSLEFKIKTIVFEGLALANGKGINKNIKNAIEIYPKFDEQSMQTLCSKSDATIIENHRKLSRRGNPQS